MVPTYLHTTGLSVMPKQYMDGSVLTLMVLACALDIQAE